MLKRLNLARGETIEVKIRGLGIPMVLKRSARARRFSLQVSEALKILCGAEVSRKITTVDVWSGEIRQLAQPSPDERCPACGRREFAYLNGERRSPVSLCGRDAVQIHERTRPLDLEDLAARLAPLGVVRANEFALRFETPPYLLTVFPDGRAIVKGTTDVGVARSLYARYVGA